MEVSFTEETLIKIKQRYKKIVDIKIGDKVLSENEKTGEIDYKPVKQLFENKTDVLIKVYVSDEEIKTTENHPFYVENKGWCYAKDLKIGDNLKLANGESKLVENIRIEILTKPIKVYNFEVEDWHTYFVTDKDILVHNMCNDVNSYIKHDTYNQIRNKLGENATKKFVDSMNKGFVSGKGANGIKILKGNGVNIRGKNYKYEIKVKGNMGDYRVFGNYNETTGQIVFDLFDRGDH